MSKHGSIVTEDGEIVSGKIVSEGPSAADALVGIVIGGAIAGPLGAAAGLHSATSDDSRTIETADGTTITGKKYKG